MSEQIISPRELVRILARELGDSRSTGERMTPAELIQITGEETPEGQYRRLIELGVRPILSGGQCRVYREAVIRAMVATSTTSQKPSLNL